MVEAIIRPSRQDLEAAIQTWSATSHDINNAMIGLLPNDPLFPGLVS
jgi:hypothetical protein